MQLRLKGEKKIFKKLKNIVSRYFRGNMLTHLTEKSPLDPFFASNIFHAIRERGRNPHVEKCKSGIIMVNF